MCTLSSLRDGRCGCDFSQSANDSVHTESPHTEKRTDTAMTPNHRHTTTGTHSYIHTFIQSYSAEQAQCRTAKRSARRACTLNLHVYIVAMWVSLEIKESIRKVVWLSLPSCVRVPSSSDALQRPTGGAYSAKPHGFSSSLSKLEHLWLRLLNEMSSVHELSARPQTSQAS